MEAFIFSSVKILKRLAFILLREKLQGPECILLQLFFLYGNNSFLDTPNEKRILIKGKLQ